LSPARPATRARPALVEPEWIDTTDGVVALAATLTGEPAIGIDTEFHRERTYFPQVALIQVAWSGGIALIDTTTASVTALAPVLTGPAVVVMHAAAQDLEVLDRSCGAIPARLFDTQLAAGFIGYGSPSLATLVERELGFSLPKGDRLTDWLRRPLNAGQRAYAASDVEFLLELHDRLVAELEGRGRLQWAVDECEELRERGGQHRDPDEVWWRIKEARQLRGTATGVAQAVAAWRERRAAAVDQPSRFVLPDLALVGIAQRPPKSIDELRRVRGLDERHLRGGAADEILDAVRQGLALPRSALHLPPVADVDRELRPAVTLVSAWVSQLGRDLRIDPSILATRSDIEALLRDDPDARLASGWRGEAVGAAIRQLVSGGAALSFDGHGGLILEARSHRPLTTD
jgi:ribonuclease D